MNFPLAQRGYSRDQRGDCKQVTIGLVVSRCGMPLGYEVFAGNTTDVTTVETIVTLMEKTVWKIQSHLGDGPRHGIGRQPEVSAARSPPLHRRYSEVDAQTIRARTAERRLAHDTGRFGSQATPASLRRGRSQSDGEPSLSTPDETETFILCRSRDRFQKEDAIVRRFEKKIEERLVKMAARCERQKRDPQKVEREVGRLLGQNTRAAKLFEVTVKASDAGHARLKWKKIEDRRNWATLSAGCYLLRTNITDWSDEDLWKAYIQLTEAEAAFRTHKTDLSIRPIWHQKQERVLAHILVCFLVYVLWKTLGQLCQRANLGNEPRRVLSELSEIRFMDVVLPTREGPEIRKRCIARPSDHQQILLDHLGLSLPNKTK